MRNSIDILFDDADIVVVNKPSGRPVHPSPGHETNSLTEELVQHFPQMANVGSSERPGVVHRLDIETSGVMVFAKTQRAYLALRKEFESHENVDKTYLAVVHGSPKNKAGTIDEPVGRDHRRAVSHWTVLGKNGPVSLVEFRIETGRMHQIRLHAKSLGCPVVGDLIYGDRQRDGHLTIKPKRLLLHAVELSFPHPITGKHVSFAAPPPNEIIFAR